MSYSETLKEALIRTGDQEHVQHLSEEAQNLTKEDITHFLNSANPKVSLDSLRSLRKLAKQRMMEGKSVFPWDKMEDIEHNEADDNMGGGAW